MLTEEITNTYRRPPLNDSFDKRMPGFCAQKEEVRRKEKDDEYRFSTGTNIESPAEWITHLG